MMSDLRQQWQAMYSSCLGLFGDATLIGLPQKTPYYVIQLKIWMRSAARLHLDNLSAPATSQMRLDVLEGL